MTNLNKAKSTSIIVPVYYGNELDEVKKCLNSLLNQTYTYYKILLVYDGPIISSVKNYLDKIVFKYDKISKININQNVGLAKALNHAIKEESADFIVRVDADSISKPNRLKTQINFLRENKLVDVVGAIVEEKRENGKSYYQKMPLNHEDCLSEFKFRNPISHPTAVFRKTFFEKAGLYPENYYKDEDSALWLNGFLNGCIFSNLDEALVECKLDNDLLNRRKDFRGIIATFQNKVRICYLMKFGFTAYCFALMRLIIMLSPKKILMMSYLLRNQIWKIIKK